MLKRILAILFITTLAGNAWALDTDSEQPATLDADDMEMDFASGQRIYRGNVVFRQGSLKMNCDELSTFFDDDGELDKAICVGGPGRFKQRPQGAEEDVVGTAMTITMDRINDLVKLKTQAKVVQGGMTITGRLITYDLKTEKASVKGGTTQSAGSGTSAAPAAETSTEGGEAASVAEESTSRPSLVIAPRKKKTEEPADGESSDSTGSGTAE